ncbi:MAG: helix-turn-helix transcriptional regulator [Proteobacteria bacterium]|nr:helix-turn-helix transcriptional regulator [Pseudomonadota bacterium]
MARAALGWGVRDLAKKTGISANTISRFENGTDARGSTLRKIQRALEDSGILFISGNGGGVGVRFRDRKRGCTR